MITDWGLSVADATTNAIIGLAWSGGSITSITYATMTFSGGLLKSVKTHTEKQ